MKLTQYLYPEKVRCPTSCTSLCTSSNGLEACHSDGGKGLECIFPARQGSQTGSGAFFDSRVIPVTRFSLSSLFTPARWWWAYLLCERSKSKGIVVAREACSTRGTV